MFAKFLWLAVWVGLACASPVANVNFQLHESSKNVPQGFTAVGPAAPESMISLRLALAQSNAPGVVDALYSVSDPSSPQYGQHKTKEEIESLVSPSSDTRDVVNAWLQANNLKATMLSPAGDWISVQVPVSQANALFDTTFTTYVHDATGNKFIRTLSYSLPENLQGHVDLVYPTVSFPVSNRLKTSTTQQKRSIHNTVKRDLTSTCANGTIPACLQDLYQIPITPATQKNNSLGITGFFGNVARYSWLETFLQTYRPDMDPTTSFNFVGIDGGVNDQTGPTVSEGQLDVQYTVGLATDINVTYYFIGLNNQDGDLGGYLDEANYLLSLENPPLVLTTSYGSSESDLTFVLADKLCQVYAQLGARGTTILYASGDGGVGCDADNSTLFAPTFPSNCPYVTSVGGTQSFSPEEAWSGSSGGFSNYYPTPDYQSDVVSSWLSAHGSANAGRFNASGRAFPDIAAKADDFIIYETAFAGIQGTSAASPTVASIIALVNDRLLEQGRPPMGFLNPWLYSTGYNAFTDITTGNSSITCTQGEEARGFSAVEGWDPVTGLGSPRFDKILSLLNL